MKNKQNKPAAKPQSEEYPRKTVQCEDGRTGEERGRKFATLMTSPELAAYRVISGAEQNFDLEKHMDVPTLIETLREQAKAVNRSDLAQAEAMLINQATALQSLFARLTEKAFCAEHLPQFDSFMRMALRAQNQCRATIETLAAIKNPPVIFANQANIAHGHQQVNNGTTMPITHAHAGENKIEQNGLLTEVQHGEKVDGGRTGAASGANQELEAMEEVNGRAHTRGQGDHSTQRI
ncbi:MAG: hypothetical protein ABJA60_06100 [Nitrosospira sp.]